MNPGLKVRITVFFATILSLIAVVAWTAHLTLRRIGEVHAKVGAIQWKSFQIADHVQEAILGLNNCVMRYAAYKDPADWTSFVAGSSALGRWVGGQQPVLTAEREQDLLGQFNRVYRDYVAAAMAFHSWIFFHPDKTRLMQLTDFERQSKRVLNISYLLAEAHQESLDTFQTQTDQLLDALRFTLLVALVLLVGTSGWLAVMVYREMIAPLQVQLVESRKLAERQEKLASLGMLAAGVAHEIRNPLTAIKAWFYMQQKRLEADTPEFSDANIIVNEIGRLERIVKDVLQFARPSEPKLAAVPADQPLRDAHRLLEPELKKAGITLLLNGAVSTPIQMDLDQIKQVLINLIGNAADSIGQNGSITLRARLDEKWLLGRQTNVVILEVSDTGKGIPPEVEKRLFDPFFTTKESGTGLGLPIAARIVEKHGGALQYQTQLDRGTTFGIILPRARP